MLTILADQAAFAIGNARLFEAEQYRRRFADTLTSIARTINSTLNLTELLNLILEQLALVVEYDSASILLYENEHTLAVRAARAFEDMEDALSVTIQVKESSPNYRAIVQRKPVYIADVDNEPGWIKSSSTQNVQSWIGAPLIARDQVIGMLTVDSHQINKYNEENVKDVIAFADLVAAAVANAQTVTELRNTEASYTALFEDSTDLIIITTYRGTILNVNRKVSQMLRQPKEALIGGDLTLVDSKLRTYLAEQTEHLKSSGEVRVELELGSPYDQVVALEIQAQQVRYSGQDCVQWVGRDISARKEAERLRQDLLDMLIHDLRGPIGNLLNSIELLPMVLKTNDPSALNRLLEIAKQTSQEVRDLVDSMLDVRRLEQGEVLLQEELSDMDEIIKAVEKQVRPQAAAKAMNLTINDLPHLPPMWLDGSMIRRVLTNLLDNAIKYTPHEGEVTLRAVKKADTLTFAISDNGPGISKADQVRIFEKFSRATPSKNGPSGVGLGLAFCKLATEAHGGSISVESEGLPGQGSTFYLSLPIISEPPE
jgi:PAS domain S-box-containing protein